MYQFKTLAEIKSEVSEAREEAIREAHQACGRRGHFPSRGTFLSTAGRFGQCEPRPQAECPTWGGTFKEIEELVALCLAQYPEVTHIYIGGGYDHAESVREYTEGIYTPWAGSWEVMVWQRPESAQAAA